MSGLAGLVRLDGTPVAPGSIESMANAIAHRGGDGHGTWSSGPAGLAHAMLHTTAESLLETQPLVDLEAQLTIVADVRLDNRAELTALLDVRTETAGDAALLVAAYRRWGHGCASRLEGDFSFAVWDARERTLFCARDPFGVKPFVYSYLPGKLFAFGSEARALLALDEVPRQLDERRIADFLSIQFADHERTFHRALQRLPGGCTLTLRNGAIAIARSWSTDHVRPLNLRGPNRDREYAEGYREHFTRAVRERMRVTHPSELSSMLSGGLDSSAITCLARNELAAMNGGLGADPLPVFCWVFSDVQEADERAYQQAVIDEGGLRPITIDSADHDSLLWADLDPLLPDGPPYAPNYYLNTTAARLARQGGMRTILDGLGGDITISRGARRFVELFFHGRPFTLGRELRALADRRGTHEPIPRLFVSHVMAPLAPPWLLRLNFRLRGRPSTDPGRQILHPRLRKLASPAAVRPGFLTVRGDHRHSYRAPMIAEGLELYDRMMAHFGVEGRYPFFDRRLAEYCLSLPADQKLADGYSRIVARRAMEGILPKSVQWRAGKGAPGLHVIPALRASRAVLDPLFLDDSSALASYVDMDMLRNLYRGLVAGRPADMRSAMPLWSAAALARWLRVRSDDKDLVSPSKAG